MYLKKFLLLALGISYEESDTTFCLAFSCNRLNLVSIPTIPIGLYFLGELQFELFP